MADPFSNFGAGLESPAGNAIPVVPNNDTDLTIITRGLYIGEGGDLKVTMAGDDVVTFPGIAGGVIHPLRVRRVWATGTDATGIVAVY